jgi:hypothetical protein
LKKIILNKRSLLSYIMIALYLIGFVGYVPTKPTYAASSDYEWLKEGKPHTFLYIDKVTNNQEVVLKGEHNKATSNYRYATDCFAITKEPYNINGYFPSNLNYAYIYPKSVYDDRSGDTVKTTYTIEYDKFMTALKSINASGEDIINGSIKIYLHFVFKTFKGEVCTDENTTARKILGYKEMMEAPTKHRLGYAEWGQSTQNILRDYYNLEFYVKSSYDYKIIAVDKKKTELKGATNKSGNTIPSPLKSDEIIYDDDVNYTLSSANQELTLSGKKYKYTNTWYYEYENRASGSTKNSGNKTGSTINIKAPDAMPGSMMKIYMVYDSANGDPYKVKVVAETDSGTHIKDLQSVRDTYGGASFSFNMLAAQKFLNNKYTYQNKWKLTYVSPDGTEKSSGIINEEHIKNYIMPDAKKDSTAVFHMIYSTSAAPTPTPTPKPDEFVPPVITPPPSDSSHMEFTTPVNTGVIYADNRGSEKFTAAQGVPTTESLYGQVTAKDYLVGYTFVKKTGVKYYPITVKKDYVLTWMTATPTTVPGGGPKPVSETVTVTQTVTVARAYAYWEIQNFECYKIGNAVLRNYALPGEAITLNPNYSYYTQPSVSVRHSGYESYHIIPPTEYTNGITLPAQTIASEDSTKPSFESEDFTSYAWNMTGNISVRSDYLKFNGTTVMDDSIAQIIVPDINKNGVTQCETFINQNVLYKANNVIEATKMNGTYASNGTITYTSIATVNPMRPANPQYSIDGINKVVIHTPVVCIPSITDDNDKHSQLINPDKNSTQLILDPDPTLSDFVVFISNTGPHSNKQGYYSRDFSRSLRDPNISYIAEDNGVLLNQVRFPFDVYMDTGVAYDRTDDKFIKSHTWLTIGRTAPRFYLPMTVNEGVYTVQFRTVAVNGLPFINQTEEYANKKLANYVATNTLNVEVSGRIYGLTIYDLTDYPIWEEVFRVKNSMDFKKDFSKYAPGIGSLTYSKNRSYTYTLGTNNQYGVDTGRNTKYTFPLVNGSHPYYKNMGILKTGYMMRFLLNTTGSMFSDSCKISIKPNFYHVDKTGNNRVAVDLYYTEEISNKTRHLVKVGSSLDQTNLKTVRTGDLYLGIPEAELRQTAALRGMTYSKFTAQKSAMFNFSELRLNWAFRTYINNSYLNTVKSLDSYDAMKDSGITESDIIERMQRWYGQYYIPNEVHVVEKGFDVMGYADKYGVDYNESFWLEEGYIIVNFSIETIGEDGSRRLSYINAANYRDNGNCSMWLQEGPITSKTNSDGTTFQFYAGDFALYYVKQRAEQDYKEGAIY